MREVAPTTGSINPADKNWRRDVFDSMKYTSTMKQKIISLFRVSRILGQGRFHYECAWARARRRFELKATPESRSKALQA
jgi:hypothetical protein